MKNSLIVCSLVSLFLTPTMVQAESPVPAVPAMPAVPAVPAKRGMPMTAPLPGHGKLSDGAGNKVWHLPSAVTPPAELEYSGIERPDGGKTVAEIFDGKAELDGQIVTLRARVVKVNKAIMGHNWLHLRDGTASATGENDLTVTTDALAEVGATVTVTGKLGIDRDFGFSYQYPVLLEEGQISDAETGSE
ncbi:MAG: hypothetical protein ACI8TX_003747 [Hyphomicrobiaceae bacterium]|jgi:hypothetical protein